VAEAALAICLNNHAPRVDVAVIADLLGTHVATARAKLGELVWNDPGQRGVEAAQRFLSGLVRVKLATGNWLPAISGPS